MLRAPDIISSIHEAYLAAGADLIETNTFGATTVAQADYDMAGLAREMNLASARLARAACDKFSTPDKPRYVAGALGPTPKTASIDHQDKDVPGKFWIEQDEASQKQFTAFLRNSRLQMTKDGVYDARMMKILKKVRCTLDTKLEECALTDE